MNDSDALPLLPPRGMRDFYPEDILLREAVFQAWRNAALRYGFQEYDACVVESLELLKRKAGDEIREQIYSFKDKSDRDLALRAEMTPTLARMIAARQSRLSFPVKWFAIAQCFRYERMSKGRKREHYQWNLDIAGESSPAAEAEVVAAAVSALSALGLAGVVSVHVSSRLLLAELLEKIGIEPQCHEAVFLALDKRDKLPETEVSSLLEKAGLSPAAVDAALRLSNVRSLDQAVETMGEPTAGYRNLREFLDIISDHGMSNAVKFDISVVRGLGYYTGIVFEAFDTGKESRAVFGGGRYDHLLQDIGGKPITAVGLGFGDVVVSDLLRERPGAVAMPSHSDTIVGFMEDAQRRAAVALSEEMRRNGRNVDMCLSNMKAKAFFSKAGQGGYREAVYVGPDDTARGTARVKNLGDRTEREISLPGAS